MKKQIILSCLLLISNLCLASDGVIHFSGKIVEPTCDVQFNNLNDKPILTHCSQLISSTSIIKTYIVKPSSNMIVWYNNENHNINPIIYNWKIIEITYL